MTDVLGNYKSLSTSEELTMWYLDGDNGLYTCRLGCPRSLSFSSVCDNLQYEKVSVLWINYLMRV
jgi:hypothetical protein